MGKGQWAIDMRHVAILSLSTVTAVAAIAVAPLLAHDPITTRVTWNREISRIVQARCVSCHSPGGRAPMSLAAYEDARPWAKAIKEEVLTRRMPKWHAARGYGDFSNDPSLSPFEIALIAAWADGGAPKGIDQDAKDGSGTSPDKAPGQLATRHKDARTLAVPCGDQPMPNGLLLGVRPQIAPHASVGISVSLPDGRREIVGYIRDFEPDFATTYWLRVPLDLPSGSRIVTELTAVGDQVPCALDITMQAPR
jgi:mono/diheme cytochrome c family protein